MRAGPSVFVASRTRSIALCFTRRATARCSKVDWAAANTHYDGFVVLKKHITLTLVAERVCSKRFYAALDFSATHAATVALFSWQSVYGYQMSWSSWAWQVLRFPAAQKLWPFAVGLFPQHDLDEPLAVTAALPGSGSVHLFDTRCLA